MMLLGQKFCPHCGAEAQRKDAETPGVAAPCPRCGTGLESVVIGGCNLRECPKCEGIWTDAETLRQICADREKQAAVLGMPVPVAANEGVELEKQIRYLPCPICRSLMNRVNFANVSGVIVDVCSQHGTWFDRDELHRIVEFIRGGGLDKARAREMADLEEERRRLRAEQLSGGQYLPPTTGEDMRASAVLAAAEALFRLLR